MEKCKLLKFRLGTGSWGQFVIVCAKWKVGQLRGVTPVRDLGERW